MPRRSCWWRRAGRLGVPSAPLLLLGGSEISNSRGGEGVILRHWLFRPGERHSMAGGRVGPTLASPQSGFRGGSWVLKWGLKKKVQRSAAQGGSTTGIYIIGRGRANTYRDFAFALFLVPDLNKTGFGHSVPLLNNIYFPNLLRLPKRKPTIVVEKNAQRVLIIVH